MPMTRKTALAELKKVGSAGTKKIYLRHGACEPLFGVKFGDLGKLKKRIGVNHELAQELWATGNSDAQTLALMVVDPTKIKSAELDAWLRPLKYDLLIGMIAELAAKSAYAPAKWQKWSKSKSEQLLVAAYSLLSHWLKESPDEVPIDVVEDGLEKIESQIHDVPNRARHAMNNADSLPWAFFARTIATEPSKSPRRSAKWMSITAKPAAKHRMQPRTSRNRLPAIENDCVASQNKNAPHGGASGSFSGWRCFQPGYSRGRIAPVKPL